MDNKILKIKDIDKVAHMLHGYLALVLDTRYTEDMLKESLVRAINFCNREG